MWDYRAQYQVSKLGICPVTNFGSQSSKFAMRAKEGDVAVCEQTRIAPSFAILLGYSSKLISGHKR